MHQNFELPKSVHDAVYTSILTQALQGKVPVEHPTVIVLGGQPGAGKSALLEQSRSEFADGNVVVINGDDFRYWHPQHQTILERHEREFCHLTDPDVRVWTRRVFEFAIAGKFNIVFEGTMRTDAICGTLQRLIRQHGYKVVACVIAVHERWSAAGILHRYERMRRQDGYGRWTELSAHDASYVGMPQTVARIEQERLAHEVGVYTRSGSLLYRNQLERAGWLCPPNAVTAIWEGRDQEMTSDEANLYRKEWESIIAMMEARAAHEDELTFANKLADRYLNR